MNMLTFILVAGAVLSFTACFLLRFSRQIARLSNAFIRLPASQKVVLILGVTIATVSAQKCGTNDIDGTSGGGTNVPPLLQFVLPPSMPSVTISSYDVLRGYRLESVSLNPDVTYAMPDGAEVVGTWHLTGAYEDVVRVGISGWSFPLGTNLCDYLWAYTWGMARPQLKNVSNEIAAVGVSMSAIPDVSRFWTAATTNGSRLLTWENFVEGRSLIASSNTPTTISAQLELYPTGDFIARSNNVESVYRRVNPDDWDDDGIPNEEDPDPLLYGGNHFGPNQDMSLTSNLSAYCWVDIVVHQANARVTFAGDGASNLPDPSFIAEAEETYRVNLLIGKTYQVKCQMPFEVVGKSDNDIDTWWDDDGSLWVNWYVDMWAADGNDRSRTFRMFVSPSCLDGSFTWTKYCCSISGGGSVFTITCRDGCSCGGCCAEGEYLYEGYSLPAYGGSCACCYEDDPEEPHPDDPDDPEVDPVGVSVGFSKKVIFFEDAYANTTNQTIPWYSDVLSLSCAAYGGPNGGSVSIALSGDGNLIQYGGQVFPVSRTLQPYEVFCFTNTYRAVAASSSVNDIVVTANFVESETGWTDSSNDRATAVKVELIPERTVNGCLNRHRWGVCERVICEVTPAGPYLTIEGLNGADLETETTGQSSPTLVCPDFASQGLIRISASGESYTPTTTAETPVALRFDNVRQLPSGLASGVPGGAGMSLDVYVLPDMVSFMELRFREVPSNESDIAGYFTNTVFSNVWYHSRKRGAGTWHLVGLENFFFSDNAAMLDALITPCSGGHIYWTIPIDWKRNSGPNGLEHRLSTIQQEFEMNASGTLKVSKFGFWVERALDGSLNRSEGVSP